MRQIQFAKVHMFPYSKRDRTRAALYKNTIPSEVIKERKQRLLRLSEEVAFELREKYAGRRMQVLTEDQQGGHTGNFLWVNIPEREILPNQLLEVEIVANTPEGLVGR